WWSRHAVDAFTFLTEERWPRGWSPLALRGIDDPAPAAVQDCFSLENSRKMKEKSHRAPRECYRSVVQALRGTQTRRLDGYRLYSASDLPGRGVREARGGSLRPAGCQFRWRLGAVQGPGHRVGTDPAVGRLPRRCAGARQGAARDDRVGPAAHLRAVRGLRRLQ